MPRLFIQPQTPPFVLGLSKDRTEPGMLITRLPEHHPQ